LQKSWTRGLTASPAPGMWRLSPKFRSHRTRPRRPSCRRCALNMVDELAMARLVRRRGAARGTAQLLLEAETLLSDVIVHLVSTKLKRDRGFGSFSLQRGVRCEPDFGRYSRAIVLAKVRHLWARCLAGSAASGNSRRGNDRSSWHIHGQRGPPGLAEERSAGNECGFCISAFLTGVAEIVAAWSNGRQR
jgi:hypothetical protein